MVNKFVNDWAAMPAGSAPERKDGLPKQKAVHRVYLELRDLIVSGALAPGSPLIERRVAEVVGASRSTARNALHQLAAEGHVVVSSIGDHYSRFCVGPLTIEEMREWYFIIGALDGIAARGAAALPVAERPRLAERIRGLAKAHLEAGTGDDPQYDTIQSLDGALHRTYVEAGAGPRLLQEHAAVRPHVDRYGTFYATALIRKLPSDVFVEHCAIADAIEAGNPDAAERAAVTNWRNATVRFEEVMLQFGRTASGGQRQETVGKKRPDDGQLSEAKSRAVSAEGSAA